MNQNKKHCVICNKLHTRKFQTCCPVCTRKKEDVELKKYHTTNKWRSYKREYYAKKKRRLENNK